MKTVLRTVCAASALVAGIFSASAGWSAYLKDLSEAKDFTNGYVNCISYSQDAGGLILSDVIKNTPYLWVPCPGDNTVSKIDGRSGLEVARYQIGPNDENWTPSAVATDNEGNAYIACSCYGKQGKVVRIAMSNGVDKNGDGLILTCNDSNHDQRINPAEVLPWGKDELVTDVYNVGGVDSVPSSLLFDNNGSLWVMLWGDKAAARLNLVSKKVDATVQMAERPSTAVVDQKNNIWILSRESKTLSELSPVLNTINQTMTIDNCVPTGICVDQNDKIWISNSRNGILSYSPDVNTWDRYSTDEGFGFSSVTIDKNNNIWASCSSYGVLAEFSGDDGKCISETSMGTSPQSICADSDGYIWTLNDTSNSAVRVSPDDQQDNVSTVLNGIPFSNTAFATSVVKKGVAPSGEWSSVLDSNISGAGWGKLSWKADEIGGNLKVEARTSNSIDKLGDNQYALISNGDALSLPNGRYIELKVTFDGSMGASPVLKEMLVEGKNVAPDVTKAVPSTNILCKRDHMMESVGINGVVDPEGEPVTVQITKVEQNEPVAGLSKYDKPVDAMGIGSERVWLRDECGQSKDSTGRVYVVSFVATDPEGACSKGKVKVYVPKESETDIAINTEKMYDSTYDPSLKQIACK